MSGERRSVRTRSLSSDHPSTSTEPALSQPALPYSQTSENIHRRNHNINQPLLNMQSLSISRSWSGPGIAIQQPFVCLFTKIYHFRDFNINWSYLFSQMYRILIIFNYKKFIPIIHHISLLLDVNYFVITFYTTYTLYKSFVVLFSKINNYLSLLLDYFTKKRSKA